LARWRQCLKRRLCAGVGEEAGDLASLDELGFGPFYRLSIQKERLVVRERKPIQVEKARRVLKAAAVEAFGRPGAYVTRDLVMRRVNMVDSEHFTLMAEYLEKRGWIAEADADYGVFVLTPEGIDEAMN
jgi:hypothetical protein